MVSYKLQPAPTVLYLFACKATQYLCCLRLPDSLYTEPLFAKPAISTDLHQEKSHLELLQNLEMFNAQQLQHIRTKERVMLPDSSSEFTTSVVSVVMATNRVILCSAG